MKLPNKHDSAKVNGSVQLELRGIATGVSAAAWQLACEGVRAREHARAPLGQEEQGSTPAVAGVREQNAGGEREQSGAAKVDRDIALRGGDVVLRTEDHDQERGFPGDDEKVGGACLSSHEVWPQKGEALALACVSIGRPKAASMSSLERVGMSVAWPRRRAPWWHVGVFACVRTCGRTRALTWPDARASRRKDVLGSEVERRVVAIWMLWFRSWSEGDDWVGALMRQSKCARTGSNWRSHSRGGRISIGGKAASRGGAECRQGLARKGAKGLALTSPDKRTHGCAARHGHARAWLHKATASACAYRRPGHGGGPERRRRDYGNNATAAACHRDGAKKGERRPG
jgi:hypothetical protein